jgi:hypothetical protein
VTDTQAQPLETQDNGEPLRGSAQPLPGKCGRKLPNSNPPRYCKRDPLKGRDCCRKHGGATPRGIASANYRHGRYSIAMPTRMMESYEAFVSDPDILSLRREIASHRAIAEDLRRQLAEGDGVAPNLQKTWREMEVAIRSGNMARLQEAMANHREAVGSRASEEGLRRELRREDELIQKFTRAENDRMEQLHQMVTREQALTYMRSLAIGVKEIVDEHIADANVRQTVLRAVGARFVEFNDRRGPADIVAGGERGLPAVRAETDD